MAPPSTTNSARQQEAEIAKPNRPTQNQNPRVLGNQQAQRNKREERKRFIFSAHERRQGRKPENQNEREKRDL
jgi:hypothetical protein